MTRRKWLDHEEQRAWLLYQAMSTLVDAALDRQLQRDADMPHGYYMILARLAAAPDRSVRITTLAQATQSSQSRVSHAIAALEKRGWVSREKCADDTRGTLAVLTEAGWDVLRAAAPGHVAEVRGHVFDVLTRTQVAQFADICATVLTGLDPTYADQVLDRLKPRAPTQR